MEPMTRLKLTSDLDDPLWVSSSRACKMLGRCARTLTRWELKDTYLEDLNKTLPKLLMKKVRRKKYYYLPIVQEYVRILKPNTD